MTTPPADIVSIDAAALDDFIAAATTGAGSADGILQIAWQALLDAGVLRHGDGLPFPRAEVSVTNGEATVEFGPIERATWDHLRPLKVSAIEAVAHTLVTLLNSQPQSRWHGFERPWSRN
jgi:hypothetical protein